MPSANFTRGFSRGLPMGVQAGITGVQEGRLRDVFEFEKGIANRKIGIEEAKLKASQDIAGIAQGIMGEEAMEVQSRSEALETVQTLADLAKLPPNMRDVDTLAKAFQSKHDVTLAPNVLEIMKKGSSKDLEPIMEQTMLMVAQDPNFNMNTFNQTVTNPLAFNQYMRETNKAAQGRMEDETVGGKQEPQIDEGAFLTKQAESLQRKADKFRQLGTAAFQFNEGQGRLYMGLGDDYQARANRILDGIARKERLTTPRPTKHTLSDETLVQINNEYERRLGDASIHKDAKIRKRLADRWKLDRLMRASAMSGLESRALESTIGEYDEEAAIAEIEAKEAAKNKEFAKNKQKINDLRKEGKTDEEIKQFMRDANIDPAPYFR